MSKGITKLKDVLTTGQVARICNVAPRTVTKWFDSGQLRGYRIPGSRDRRIPAAELARFMKSHNMPTDAVNAGKLRVLIIDENREDATILGTILAAKANYDVEIAHNGFDAGALRAAFYTACRTDKFTLKPDRCRTNLQKYPCKWRSIRHKGDRGSTASGRIRGSGADTQRV